MKKVFKVFVVFVAVLFVVVGAGALYLKYMLPDVGVAPQVEIAVDTTTIERGAYLANHVAVCMDCHSTRDWSKFAGPLAGNFGGGGEKFGKEAGFPGTIYSPNITPSALKSWTDGEIYRAVTAGVSKDGVALFPVMPYHHYGTMGREDVYSIIAFVRTLPSISKNHPRHELDFPVSLLVNTMPTKSAHATRPPETDKIAYGGYLVNVAGCVDCHSQTDKGVVIKNTEFGGGVEFKQPAGVARSSNITSDETGIGSWKEADFIQKFKYYSATENIRKLSPTDINSPMPWTMYAGMKESDLSAIYAYLRTVKKIKNQVVKFEGMIKEHPEKREGWRTNPR